MSGSTPTNQETLSRLQSVNRNQLLRQTQSEQASPANESLWLRSGNYKAQTIADPTQQITVGGMEEFFGQIAMSLEGLFQDLTGGYQPPQASDN